MTEYGMQNIIKLGLLLLLFVSTSLGEPADDSQSDGEMSGLELPAPAIHLGEPLTKSDTVQLLVNAIPKSGYIEGLKEGQVVIDNVPRRYQNEEEFINDLKQKIQENNGADKNIQFKGKSYKTMLDGGSVIILNSNL